MSAMHLLVAIIGAAASLAQGAGAQTGSPAPAPPAAAPQAIQLLGDARAMRYRMYEAISGTTVSIQLDHVPTREAFDRLGRMLPVPLIGRYRDDALGFGLDPDLPITFEATDRPALEVLENVLKECTRSGAECTWQIRQGFIEFGTKARLSVPAARETRMYYIADLIMDVPNNVNFRTRRELNALDLVQEICETIEPGQWDYGQSPEADDDIRGVKHDDDDDDDDAGTDGATTPAATPMNAPPGASPAPPPPPPPETASGPPPQNAPPPPRVLASPRPYVAPTKTAIIRYWRDYVIVNAPDYIHRQIDGYPKPLPPAGGGS